MILRGESIYFSYGNYPVLRGADLEIKPGEVVFLIGQNGSGKTTLLKCLLGILRPQKGSVTLDGRAIAAWQPGQLARKIAYIPQSALPVFNFSVLQMVLMGRTAYVHPLSVPQEKDRCAARDALGQLGIAHLSERGFEEASGGERQLALIARALAQDGDILLMDEPAANLDYGNQHMVLQRIRDLARNGKGVLISSHNPQHALLFADRVLALTGGVILADGCPRDVLTAEVLRKIYGIEVQLAEAAGQTVIIPTLMKGRERPDE